MPNCPMPGDALPRIMPLFLIGVGWDGNVREVLLSTEYCPNGSGQWREGQWAGRPSLCTWLAGWRLFPSPPNSLEKRSHTIQPFLRRQEEGTEQTRQGPVFYACLSATYFCLSLSFFFFSPSLYLGTVLVERQNKRQEQTEQDRRKTDKVGTIMSMLNVWLREDRPLLCPSVPTIIYYSINYYY